ncbi:MAG TPA: alpha/beta hydrolase [Dehalococcoidia bacterium]|nr:alpha/beta hydrolase [Dehalococcoidia bacterium]
MNYECNRMLNGEMNAWEEPELARRCREIRVPVLVVHGELDPRPSWGTETLVEALPDVERAILEGAGHLPWIEREEALRDALRGFVAKVAA